MAKPVNLVFTSLRIVRISQSSLEKEHLAVRKIMCHGSIPRNIGILKLQMDRRACRDKKKKRDCESVGMSERRFHRRTRSEIFTTLRVTRDIALQMHRIITSVLGSSTAKSCVAPRRVTMRLANGNYGKLSGTCDTLVVILTH